MLDAAVILCISVLCGMGIGGGGLPVLYLTLVRNMEQKSAQGLNLILFICAAAGAFAVNLRKGKLNAKRIIILAAFGSLFALLGAYLSAKLPSPILRKLFGSLLIFSGIKSLLTKEKSNKS